VPSVNDSLVVFLHGVGASGADLARLAEPLSAFLPTAAFAAPDAPGRFDGAVPGGNGSASPESAPTIANSGSARRARRSIASCRRRSPSAASPAGSTASLCSASRRARSWRSTPSQRPLAGRRGRRLFRPVARRSRSASRRCGDAGAAVARRGRCDRPRGGKPPRRDAAEGGGFRGRSARLRAARPFDFRRRRRSGGDLPRPRAEAA